MKAADLRDLTREELLAKLKEVSEELFNLTFNIAGSNWTTPPDWGRPKDLARVKTVLRGKAGQE
jgi:large subunit ribosomal protein L29